MSKIIASEYVSKGHPDKMADQVSDAVLDECLRQDPNTRAGIEVLIKDNTEMYPWEQLDLVEQLSVL